MPDHPLETFTHDLVHELEQLAQTWETNGLALLERPIDETTMPERMNALAKMTCGHELIQTIRGVIDKYVSS